MRRVYENSWSGLSEWVEGAHSHVSERMSRLLEPLETTAPLAALYFDRDSYEEQSYSCLLAADGWLHELQASIAGGIVTLESWPLSEIQNIKVTITAGGPGTENYSVAFSIKKREQFEWNDAINPEMGPGTRASAESALRFAGALRRMLASA